MTRKKILLLILTTIIIAAVVSFSGCSCNCGKNSSEQNFVKGYITVVGNEPFTKLAIKTGDDKIYILQCSKELKEDLWKKQGGFFYILYSGLGDEEGTPAVTVEKVIPLNIDFPKVEEKLAPGSAAISCEMISIADKGNYFLAKVKIRQLFGAGSATKPVVLSEELNVIFEKVLLGKDELEKGKFYKIIITQPLGGMNIDTSDIWSVIQIIK